MNINNEITEEISKLNMKDENIKKQRAAEIIQRKYKKYKLESVSFLKMINSANNKYMETGANSRAPDKVNIIHQWIEEELKKILPYHIKVKQEQQVESNTKSGKKRCDIVAYKDGKPYIIFPVKYIMSSYNKNSNNMWENMQGELMSLKTHAAINGLELYIIPINIISNLIPNRQGNEQIIKNMENITYEKSFKVYETLKTIPSGTMKKISPLCMDVISYIIDVEHLCSVGDKYDKCPKTIGFNKDTPYRHFSKILSPLI